MRELSPKESFIVRVYRSDPDDRQKIAGLIERLDGSGTSEPFQDAAELGAIVSRHVELRGKRKKRSKKGGTSMVLDTESTTGGIS